MLAALLVALVLAPGAVWQDQTGSVIGQVRSDGEGTPLRFATVEALVPGRAPIAVVTDSLGRYALRGVPPGRRLVRVTHFDHAPHETELAVLPGNVHSLDFVLELRPVRLDPVTARTPRGTPGTARDTAALGGQADLGGTGVHVLEATPGVAELGLAEAAREVPGQEPPEPTDVLFVRGGAADLKLVLLDGAPVYAPFHLGGLIEPFDAPLLRSARLYLGGAPARFDGGLSYVMDLESRSGNADAAHAIAGFDLLSARTLLEGPIGGRVRYLLGGRALHGLGGEPFVGDPFPYTYGDGLARFDADLGRLGHLTATGFWNHESVLLDTLRMNEAAAWGNSAGSVRYRGRLGGTNLMLTAARGHFHTQLPLGGVRPLITDGAANRVRLALDADMRLGSVLFQFGGGYDEHRYSYRAWALGATPDSALLQSTAEGDVTGAYIDATFPVWSRVVLRAGLRGDIFSTSPAVRLAPRLAATVTLTDRSTLTLSSGRYRQYVRAPATSLVFVGSAVPDTVSAPPLSIARANHFIAALDHSFAPGLALGVEGFYKAYEGVPGTRRNTAEASGIDLWIRSNSGAVDGWLGYSLAWIWSLDQTRVRPTNVFTGRQLLSGGIVAPIPGGGIVDVRFGFGAGLPYTAIPEPEAGTPVFSMMSGGSGSQASALASREVPSLPAEPDRPHLRLDAQIARTWRSDWQGHEFRVTPYIKVLNALNRRETLFVKYTSETEQWEALAGLPVLPVVGVEWRF
jgi:hypothetical protein